MGTVDSVIDESDPMYQVDDDTVHPKDKEWTIAEQSNSDQNPSGTRMIFNDVEELNSGIQNQQSRSSSN